MKRFVSKLKFALPVVALLASTALFTTPAKAWEQSWQSSDGSVSMWYQVGSGGQTKCAVVIEDGKYGVYFEQGVIDAVFDKIGSSNPYPSDPHGVLGTFKPDFEELLKNLKGAKWEVRVDPESSPLGGYINRNGGGKVPHWNPGPDDDGSPGSSYGQPNKPEVRRRRRSPPSSRRSARPSAASKTSRAECTTAPKAAPRVRPPSARARRATTARVTTATTAATVTSRTSQ